MYLFGLVIALIIGIILGLIGGGGSILTVPLVHYFFGKSMLIATSYSLFVVAVASGIATIMRAGAKEVDFRQGIIFAIPSMLTAFSIRLFVMPLFPITFSLNNWTLSRDITITVLLILVMLYTAYRTMASKREVVDGKTSITAVILFGILTGLLSGFIGAGGGFIIVPILLRMGLDMKKAIGTSMLIITIQSVVALLGDAFNKEIRNDGGLDLWLLLLITILTVVGVLVGIKIQKKFSPKLLKKIFGLVLLLVSIGLIIKMIFAN